MRRLFIRLSFLLAFIFANIAPYARTPQTSLHALAAALCFLIAAGLGLLMEILD